MWNTRLNNLAVLNVHKDIADSLDMSSVANDFISVLDRITVIRSLF